MREAEVELLQQQLDDTVRKGNRWQNEARSSVSSKASAYNCAEPAPEPPGSAPYSAEALPSFAGDLVSADEVLEAQVDAESQDLITQLSTIERQLLELDKKWRTAENERREGELVRSGLAEKLKVSEGNHETLQAQHSQLQNLHETVEANG